MLVPVDRFDQAYASIKQDALQVGIFLFLFISFFLFLLHVCEEEDVVG